MRYSTSSIDRVRDADIVKTIENYLQLTKEGSNYKCKSPFAEEKTPSFVVSPGKQMFKCFSTSIGGDGIKFVMEHEKVDFIEAVEIIAGIHNIFLEKQEVTPEIQRKMDQKSEMYKVVNEIATSYLKNYNELDDTHWAKQLITNRKFKKDTLISFAIGFNKNDNSITNTSIEKGVFNIVKELGLSNNKGYGSYDVFKNRIIFPIHNHKGTIIGFGGRRSNDEDVSKYPKYINSKASLIYDKSSVLYGFYQAKTEIGKLGSVILTEGYTDVMAMHQNNCKNTVSTSGTALSENQINIFKKYAQEVILLRDGDKAGIKATIRDIDICLANGLNVSLCMLPEGEDPDTFSRKQENMQTWITNNKQDAILWKVSQYDLIRDRYQNDIDRIKEVANNQIDKLKDELIPKEELSNLKGKQLDDAKESNKSILEQITEVKKETKEELRNTQQIDPYKKSAAVTSIAKTLFTIKKEVKRSEYIKQVAKVLHIPASSLKAEIGLFEKQETEKTENDPGKISIRGIKLPEGKTKEETEAIKQEYMEGHGFVTVGNSYHFHKIQNNDFFQGTTFKLEPLFHIQGDKENKRLCEITNLRGKKRLIDFDSDMLANFNEFRKYLFRIGGFMFLTHNGLRTEHFDKFVYRFEEQFEPALELLTMGWNKKGFFAFANGVFWNDKFNSVNKYGIMRLEGISDNDTTTGYNEKIENYYSPAFSVMHKDNQEGDDDYENDRFFVYKQSAISLTDWIKQLIKVFGEKGITGALFNFSTIFRDVFISHNDFFPLLGGFGEKDSGKSAFGKILQNFFYFRLPALDLTQATHVGFSRRLSRNTNTTQFCDEYQDKNVREEVFNGLMGAWNGIGREKGKGVGTNKTSYDKINSSVYYAGQFMPTKMENALATRTISHFFQTKTTGFTSQEKADFNKLLNWTNEGISSLVIDIVKHRTYFEQRLPTVQAECERTLKELLKEEQYQERVFGNTAVLYTTYSILKDKIDFPFDEKQVQNLCVKLIIDNSSQIADSNGLTEFWSIITFLFEQSYIKYGSDFIIDKAVDIKIIGEKRKPVIIENQNRDNILYLRLKSVYQFYNKEVSKREGVDVIGQTTIRHYFKSRPYFIGLVKAKYFGKAGAQSCYAFNYDMMTKKNLVTLQQFNEILDNDNSGKEPQPVGESDEIAF